MSLVVNTQIEQEPIVRVKDMISELPEVTIQEKSEALIEDCTQINSHLDEVLLLLTQLIEKFEADIQAISAVESKTNAGKMIQSMVIHMLHSAIDEVTKIKTKI